jgi:hypothetical protein
MAAQTPSMCGAIVLVVHGTPVTGTSDLMRTAISNSSPSRPKLERRMLAPDSNTLLASTTPAIGWSIRQNACIAADVSPTL